MAGVVNPKGDRNGRSRRLFDFGDGDDDGGREMKAASLSDGEEMKKKEKRMGRDGCGAA